MSKDEEALLMCEEQLELEDAVIDFANFIGKLPNNKRQLFCETLGERGLNKLKKLARLVHTKID